MNSLIIAMLYLVAYNTHGRFLAQRIFKIDPAKKCPSETHHDGVDFVKTNKLVLFGHHFTSIAGTGPIVGPAIAIIWGWLPALIWILIGSIFMGAVHDFGSKTINLVNFYNHKESLLFAIGSIISVLQIWMVVEGVIVLARLRNKA